MYTQVIKAYKFALAFDLYNGAADPEAMKKLRIRKALEGTMLVTGERASNEFFTTWRRSSKWKEKMFVTFKMHIFRKIFFLTRFFRTKA